MALPVTTRWSDTNSAALEVFVELHRKMPVAQKLARVFELSEMLFAASVADVRRCYPEAGEKEVFLRMAARRLGRELMIRAYGWNTDAGTAP